MRVVSKVDGRWLSIGLVLLLSCVEPTERLGYAQCEFQCEVQIDCLDLLVVRDVLDPADALVEDTGSDVVFLDYEVCVDRCSVLSVQGSYRTCAREAWGAIHDAEENAGDRGLWSDAEDACSYLLSGDCPSEVYATTEPSGCSASPRSGPGVGWLILAGVLVWSRRSWVGVAVGSCAVMTAAPVARAQSVDLGSANLFEIGAGIGFVEPEHARLKVLNAVPVYGALHPGYDRSAPGPYAEATVTVDSSLFGLRRNDLPVSLVLHAVSSRLYARLFEEVREAPSLEVGGQELDVERLAVALRARFSDRLLWVNTVLVGQNSGWRYAAVSHPDIQAPFTTYLSTDEVLGWTGGHVRFTSVARFGVVLDEVIGADASLGCLTIQVSSERERPGVIDVGLAYEHLAMPVVDLTRLDSLVKLGVVGGLSTDPALTLEDHRTLDYFFGVTLGSGVAQLRDVTLAIGPRESSPYLDTQVELGLTVIPLRGRRSHAFLRLGHHIDRTFVFARPQYGVVGVRTMLSSGVLY